MLPLYHPSSPKTSSVSSLICSVSKLASLTSNNPPKHCMEDTIWPNSSQSMSSQPPMPSIQSLVILSYYLSTLPCKHSSRSYLLAFKEFMLQILLSNPQPPLSRCLPQYRCLPQFRCLPKCSR